MELLLAILGFGLLVAFLVVALRSDYTGASDLTSSDGQQ